VPDLFGALPDALRTPPATPIEPAVSDRMSSGPVAHAPEMSLAAPEPAFKGAGGLAKFQGRKMLVRKTFVEVVDSSPRGRTATSPLAGNTEPPGFAPQPFKLMEEPTTDDESPVQPSAWKRPVISLKKLLAPSEPGRDGNGAIPIQLNLNVWLEGLPPSTSRATVATELPQRVRIAEHHFPVPRAAPEASPPGADSVCRCLF